jgi:hypothetical protein
MQASTKNFEPFTTREERLVECRRLLSPYQAYFRKKRGWGKEALSLVKQRGMKNEKGKEYTIDQIRHVQYGNLAIVELAQLLVEIAEKKKAAISQLRKEGKPA